MSQNFQPPTPAPSPYAEAPAPAPAPAYSSPGLGVLAAVVAAIAAAAVYGWIISATDHQIGYAAVGVGALVGFAAGKAGGRSPALPPVAALLALAAVFAGQLFAIVLIFAGKLQVSAFDILGQGASPLMEVWKEAADPLTFVFLAIGGYAAFQISRKTAT
ncbi:hypothetical protein ABZW32_13875 [Streptomyces sp. NPDC004667]|uniref:hypothetical protein n=1 Tax=Streptomyces sp. NPDC004667 TaxID=3154285 RepID=UPI0033B60735